ncbi:US12 family protein [Cryobacterium aureum]|uniref:US12 family protein n=1 Tax=Cryobacterium aureum TaxID=995037 RepID=UPI000CF4A9C5|nr:US12 family protein [Cryobacterium aureum]
MSPFNDTAPISTHPRARGVGSRLLGGSSERSWPPASAAHRTSADLLPLRFPRTLLRGNGRITVFRSDQNGLGARHLGIGMSISGAFIAVFLLARLFIERDPAHVPVLSILAWVILLTTAVAVHLAVHKLASRLPLWLFLGALGACAVVVALDLAGSWGAAGAADFPTAAPAVGAFLLSIVTLRETGDITMATVALGLAMSAATLFETRTDLLTLGPDILSIALAVAPSLVGASIVQAFRRMVQRELDLVLVQSTVSQPRFAVGMLASEQLARLDLDAETLLDDVAQGRTALPLAPSTATTAASLATQLRLHLIEGRTETWLHHAVTESEFLGPVVALSDPAGLAGLLSPPQRDGLLLTIWLLIGDTARSGASVSLRLGPIAPTHGAGPHRKVRFPVELTTTGVARRRVDPETWQAIRAIGPHVDSNRAGSLRVDIECSVDNPADA